MYTSARMTLLLNLRFGHFTCCLLYVKKSQAVPWQVPGGSRKARYELLFYFNESFSTYPVLDSALRGKLDRALVPREFTVYCPQVEAVPPIFVEERS